MGKSKGKGKAKETSKPPSIKQLGTLVNEGVRFQKEGEFVKAREIFDQVLALKPDQQDALYNMAVLALEEIEESEQDRPPGDLSFLAVIHESLNTLRGIITRDTSGRGEIAGMAHRTIAKTLFEYHVELSATMSSADDASRFAPAVTADTDDCAKIIATAEHHFEKARTILHNSQDLDSIIFEHANLKKVQMGIFLSSTDNLPPRQRQTLSSATATVVRTNAILNKALDLLSAVSSTIDDALQTPYSSDIDLDCFRLHTETLDEFWDWFLLPKSIEHLEQTMTNADIERVSRNALDRSVRVALALTALTSDDDGEFLAHRGDLYQAILRFERVKRVRGVSGSQVNANSSSSRSSCTSGNIESLCCSLMRARLEAVLTRCASTARGLVDLADSLAFIVSEAVFMPDLFAAFLPIDESGAAASGETVASSSCVGSSSSKKKEMMTTANGCIQVALQLVNTMALSAGGEKGSDGKSVLPVELQLSFSDTPSPAKLLLKIAKRCYEGAISLWKNGRMSREEYVEFDFDVAYYNLACVCWRLQDESGCHQALTVCLYLEIASQFEDSEEIDAFSKKLGVGSIDKAAVDRIVRRSDGDADICDPKMNELSALMKLVLQIRSGGGKTELPSAATPAGTAATTSTALDAPALPPSQPVISSRLYTDISNDVELKGIEHRPWFQQMFC